MLHNLDQDIVAVVILFIDDLLIIANKGLIGHIEDQMERRFRMHDLGCASFYLQMNIQRNRELHTIHILQHSYIRTILAMLRMDESTPVAMPIAMKLYKSKPDEEPCDLTIYQLMIGSQMYTITTTCPDIAYAIGVPCQYNYDLRIEHMVALKHVFRYLSSRNDWRPRSGGALGGEGEGALR